MGSLGEPGWTRAVGYPAQDRENRLGPAIEGNIRQGFPIVNNDLTDDTFPPVLNLLPGGSAAYSYSGPKSGGGMRRREAAS